MLKFVLRALAALSIGLLAVVVLMRWKLLFVSDGCASLWFGANSRTVADKLMVVAGEILVCCVLAFMVTVDRFKADREHWFAFSFMLITCLAVAGGFEWLGNHLVRYFVILAIVTLNMLVWKKDLFRKVFGCFD